MEREFPPLRVLRYVLEDGADAWVAEFFDVPVHVVRTWRNLCNVPPPRGGKWSSRRFAKDAFMVRWHKLLDGLWDGQRWLGKAE